MRKSMGVFIALLVIAVSAAAVSFAAVDRTGHEIEIDEEILYGDKTVAEGLSLEIPVSLSANLFWDTTYVVGKDSLPQTDVWFTPTKHYEYGSGVQNSFSLITYGGGGASTTGTMVLENYAPYGMEEAFIDVAARTAPGEEHTELVRYRDYREFYPLCASVIINNQECVGEQGYNPGDDKQALTDQEYLVGQMKVPIPEDCYIDITIQKNEDGGVCGYDYYLVDGGMDTLNAVSAVTDRALYYAVEARVSTEAGEKIPAEGMEDWYGIYRMNYQIVKNGDYDVVVPDLENIERVIPLDTEVRLLEMRSGKDENKMLLFTAEDGMTYLNVIDYATLETVQRLELFPADEDVVSREIIYKDGLLVWTASDYQMAVLTEPDRGVYELEFTGSLWTEEMKAEIGTLHMSIGDMAVDYDGEKLAIVYPQPYYYRYERQSAKGTCLFWVMIYDESGMLYCGEYAASQGVGEDFGSAYCNIRDDMKMGVSWGE
ncbi:MAG: hypothetical protein IJZ85_12810 [Lachnospiraceae bacterium]|nr:hypothetical protein [Lachnospiraceae bacterium]